MIKYYTVKKDYVGDFLEPPAFTLTFQGGDAAVLRHVLGGVGSVGWPSLRDAEFLRRISEMVSVPSRSTVLQAGLDIRPGQVP